MSGVTRLFLAGGGDDRVPPHVRRQFSAGRFFRRDQTGSHIRLPVNFFCIEVIRGAILHIDQDVVVFGRPPALGTGAVVVRPNDFIEETIPAKDHVAHDLRVVHLAVIQVQIQSPVLGEEIACRLQPGKQERPVILEGVVVTGQRLYVAGVALAFEAAPIRLIRFDPSILQTPPHLRPATYAPRGQVRAGPGAPGRGGARTRA